MDERTFGGWLVDWRRKSGLSLEAVARICGTHRWTVGRWERGAAPHVSSALELLSALPAAERDLVTELLKGVRQEVS